MRIAFGAMMLSIVYCLALASSNPWDLALGVILGLAVLLTFRAFLLAEPAAPASEAVKRAIHLPRLIVATAAEIVSGTVQVAGAVLSPRIPDRAGFVTIPDANRTSSGVVISGLLNTLSPGSVLIEVHPDPGSWTIHALDASDEQKVIEQAQEFYERFQRPVWP